MEGGQVCPEFTTKNQSFPKMTMENCGNTVRGCENTVKQNAYKKFGNIKIKTIAESRVSFSIA